MKIVVIKSPKFLSGILRAIFKIKKENDINTYSFLIGRGFLPIFVLLIKVYKYILYEIIKE